MVVVKLKLDLSDGTSNNSDFSNDSQNSQMSTADFMASVSNGVASQTSNGHSCFDRSCSGSEDFPKTKGSLVDSIRRVTKKKNRKFLNFEGLNSGVPTRTTPTLTPTTLRNIEQTFIELQSETESHENEAGFVPPLVHSIGNNQYVQASEVDIYSKSILWQPSLSQSSSDSNNRPTPPLTPKNGVSNPPQRRNMGGRKPAKELHLSPEEEERRRVRRERNKAAAARCRKRRVDHTNALIEETDKLEQKKVDVLQEIQKVQYEKEELECILENHKNSNYCKYRRSTSPQDIKPYDLPLINRNSVQDRVKTEYVEQIPLDDEPFQPPSKKIMLSQTIPTLSKPCRPRTLDVQSAKTVTDLTGISISTPSTGIQFNFESLMVGGTGLTPVSGPLAPTCSTQIRMPLVSSADITSPDSCGPPKLVSL